MNYIKAGKWLTVFLTFLGILLFIDLFPKEGHDQKTKSKQKPDYRAAYHFTTPDKWKNDPQKPIYFDGKYHYFYLYNRIIQKATAQNGAMPSQTIWCTGQMKAWRFRNIQTRTVIFGPVPSWWIKRTQPASGKMRLSRL